MATVSDILERADLAPVQSPYQVETIICVNCMTRTPVFRWPPFLPYANLPPPDPAPRTLAEVFSDRLGDTFWSNHCVWCHSPLGE